MGVEMTLPSRQKNFASEGDVRPWFLEAVGMDTAGER